jgi:cell division protein FtsI (penicillin-binding protein 3)
MAPLIGVVGRDGIGLEGVEFSFEETLRGEPGSWSLIRTCDGDKLCCPELQDEPGKPGEDLTLTIDLDLQMLCYEALAEQVTRMSAKRGFVLVTDPMNGDILALANYPSYDPEDFSSDRSPILRNRALTDPYEPGSTLKLIVYSAAYRKGFITPEDSVDTGEGTLVVQRKKIRDVHPMGKMTYREALVHSSNVATVKLALEMGPKDIYEMAREFGFGSKSEVPLRGEGCGKLKNYKSWKDVYTASFSIGYSVFVNPFQMAAAYGAVANGGELLIPRLLKNRSETDPGNEKDGRHVLRRAIDQETAKLMRDILEDVVLLGTGVNAQVRGIRVAGKTGTAMIVNSKTRMYDNDLIRASFIGFFPVENPEYLIYVVIDEPDTRKGRYGSTVAAPLFRDIALKVL